LECSLSKVCLLIPSYRATLFALSGVFILVDPALAVTLNLAHTAYAYPTAFGNLDAYATGDCLEGLMTEDARGAAIPGQAESWTISPDGLVYTFTLREGIVWSDGQPVVAADFLTSFQWLFDPVNAVDYAYLQFPIRNASAIAAGSVPMESLGVTALDERTLEITLERPTPYFLETLTHSTAYPVPSQALASNGVGWLVPENVLCNGPFSIVEQDETHARAIRSETYYARESVAIDEIKYEMLDDVQAGLTRFKAGEFDVFYGLPGTARAWTEQNVPDEVNLVPSLGVSYYAINVEKPPFDNPAVRQALSMSIDRVMVDPGANKSAATVAYGLVPSGTSNYADIEPYRPDWASWPLEQRIEVAAATIARLGYSQSNPLEVELRFPTNPNGSNQAVARQVAGMWSRIGVKVELLGTAPTEHHGALRAGDFDVGRFTWVFDYSDPYNVLELLTETSDFNVGRYSNEAYDQLLADASVELDLDKRAALLAQAERLVVDEVAVIPVSWVMAQNLIADGVSGIEDNAKNIHRSRWLTKEAP
jgi:oligopeptide transport system substrate-binding protein